MPPISNEGRDQTNNLIRDIEVHCIDKSLCYTLLKLSQFDSFAFYPTLCLVSFYISLFPLQIRTTSFFLLLNEP